jgi:hypothetical protein
MIQNKFIKKKEKKVRTETEGSFWNKKEFIEHESLHEISL